MINVKILRTLWILVIAVAAVTAAKAQTAVVRGKVYTTERNPLSGAIVQIKALKKGTTTKKDGSFTLSNLPAGKHIIEVAFVGYETLLKTVTLAEGETKDISLTIKEKALETDGVSVYADRRKQEQTDTRPSVLTVDPREAKYKAGAVEDVFRTLQSMPGVTAPSDFSSQLVVRGSGPDQNLILLDNIEVFNPYRLYGFISLFNPETVSGVSLMTGGFPAKYGDRLSAVLDVSNREGYTGNGYLAGKLNMSLTNANLVTEGAIPYLNGSWLLSTRRTYYDLIAGPIARSAGAVDGDVALPNFRDVQMKIALQPADEHKFLLNGLLSRDNTEFTSGANRKVADSASVTDRSYNSVGGASWIWTPSSNYAMTTGLSYYQNKGTTSFGGAGGSQVVLGTTEQVSLEELRRIQDSLRQKGLEIPTLFTISGETGFNFRKASLKNDSYWEIDSVHRMEFGLQYDQIYTAVIANFEFDPRLKALQRSNPRIPPLPESFENGVEYFRAGMYAQDNIRLTKELTLQPGARFDYYAVLSKAYVAPRFSASYALSPATTVRGAWGIYYQSPGYEKLFDAQVFLDFSGDNITNLRAEQAMHSILGIEHMLDDEWQVRVEGYYKNFSDLILPQRAQGTIWKVQRIEGLADSVYRTRSGWTAPQATQGDSLTTVPINSATGEAYGVEFLLQKIRSRGDNNLYGWISYSFAFANRYREGLVIPFNFDRRHSLNIVGGYKLSKYFDLSFTFTYGSGFPWTKALGIKPRVITTTDSSSGATVAKLDTDWRGVVFDVDRGGLDNVNKGRLPDYHRLDVRLTTYAHWFDWDWSFYLDVINVYNHSNIISEQYRVNRETLTLETRQQSMLPILPTLGFSIKF